MTATIVVGISFAALILFGSVKAIKDIRNNSCAGCSGGCSSNQRSSCHKMREINDGKANHEL